MPKRSKSSARWLHEHETDPFVKAARQAGFRSRAVYKLEEIQRTERLLRPGMTVVDLGAAPGGWSQYAARLFKGRGRVVALDILPMEPLPGVEFIQGDFTDEAVFNQILDALGDRPVDLIISDIAPNISGIDSADQASSMYLVELALDMARRVLKPKGNFVAKVFQGVGSDAYLKDLRSSFEKVSIRKPAASRARSREVYVVARGFKGK